MILTAMSPAIEQQIVCRMMTPVVQWCLMSVELLQRERAMQCPGQNMKPKGEKEKQRTSIRLHHLCLEQLEQQLPLLVLTRNLLLALFRGKAYIRSRIERVIQNDERKKKEQSMSSKRFRVRKCEEQKASPTHREQRGSTCTSRSSTATSDPS